MWLAVYHRLGVPADPSRRAALSGTRAQSLGAAVREARQQKGLTPADLAGSAGVALEQVRRLERGSVNPTLATLYALADVLQVPVRSWLPD